MKMKKSINYDIMLNFQTCIVFSSPSIVQSCTSSSNKNNESAFDDKHLKPENQTLTNTFNERQIKILSIEKSTKMALFKNGVKSF
jgi:hypothetical protein